MKHIELKSIVAGIATALLFSGGAAQAQSQQSASGSREDSSAMSRSSATDKQASTVNSGDRKLMMQLAQSNLAEIATSKIALNQTKNPEILAYAQKLIDDHTQASTELSQLAQAKGVTLPTQPDAKHQALAKRLSRLSDEKFDKQYMSNVGVADHNAAHALLQRIASRAQDSDLKALAVKLLPIIDQHLSTAKNHDYKGEKSSGQ